MSISCYTMFDSTTTQIWKHNNHACVYSIGQITATVS